jgi:hypothetical protein
LVGEAGGRRRREALATALIVLVCALVVPAVAGAKEFTVDSTADLADAIPGVGCLTMVEECTLRAAIEESNGSEGEDRILFDEAVFDGGQAVPSTIALSGSLPAIVDPVGINGKECPTAAGVSGPCVRIDGPSANPALIVEDADFAEVVGLAITGAETGISVNSSLHFIAQADWFGVKLDGNAGGNTTGVFIGPESDEGRIGGEGPEARNVFANNIGDGLDIHGASNVKVLGNYFGVRPDGGTRAANGKDIEVTSTSDGEFEAIGSAIGTRVSSEFAATPECDRGCNVISGAESSGIDLEGDGGQEAPAVSTAIAGNYIGLNATGTAPIPNVTTGVRVGEAAHTVIGGPSIGAANRINTGSFGVLAGPAADDLAVRGNRIGTDATGTVTLAPPANGIVINSGELPNPAAEAQIVDNELRMEGGVAITQQGEGAWIFDNVIFGSETGIRTHDSSAEHGNVIEGNLIEGPELSGILIENDLNEIFGNEISGVAGAGIRIQGSFLPFGVTGNLIGGDVASDENVITGSGGDAIEVVDLEETENEVARNRGIANGGLFIDLVAASPGTEPKGPNNGIEPPGFSTSTLSSSSGSDAEAGAKVRVFRKQIADVGELESFLGEATADADGNWKVIYGGAIPAGTIVAATQTGEAGGTSELATATTSVEVGDGGDDGDGEDEGHNGGGSDSGTTSSADTTPPETKIVKAPRKKSHSNIARFRFNSNEPGSTFQCKLDGRRFGVCRSPKKYEDLAPGKHVFMVRAIDPAGNTDTSPAKRKFSVQ